MYKETTQSMVQWRSTEAEDPEKKSWKIWQARKSELHKRQYLLADKCHKWYLYKTKKEILRDKLNSGKNKTKTLYKITKSLTSDISENTLPETTSHKELADIFANFFVNKVTIK